MSTLQRAAAASIEMADAHHAHFTAQLHRRALPHGFFVGLGVRFLRAYHETFVASPHGIALTAWLDGRPVGFLVGTTANAAHYRWVLRKRGPRLLLLAVLALAYRPATAWKFVRTRAGRYTRFALRTLRRRVAPATATASGPSASPGDLTPTRVAVLTHVAVCTNARGTGIGSALVRTFTTAAAAAGATEGQLVTDADAASTHAFYRDLGWQHVEDRPSTDGDTVSRFVRPLR